MRLWSVLAQLGLRRIVLTNAWRVEATAAMLFEHFVWSHLGLGWRTRGTETKGCESSKNTVSPCQQLNVSQKPETCKDPCSLSRHGEHGIARVRFRYFDSRACAFDQLVTPSRHKTLQESNKICEVGFAKEKPYFSSQATDPSKYTPELPL